MSSRPLRWHWPVALTLSGSASDQVVHDGEIVRRQVPDHVDIVLEQAEIDARGIVVEELSEHAFVDQLADLPHGAGEEERVIDHDLQVSGGGQVDQLLRPRPRRQ